MKKTRLPYERYGVPRENIIDLHEQFMLGGWIGTAESEGQFFCFQLAKFGISSTPKNGWANLAYELRLVNLNLPDRARHDTLGRADLARECDRLAASAGALFSEYAKLTHNTEFVVAMHMSNVPEGKALAGNFIGEMNLFQTRLNKCAAHLRSTPQRPKWRQSQMRNLRVELACKLACLFELEFGLPAKPVGGSASLGLDETNDWTRFYQAVASAFWHEEVTPDRQAILWEAALPTE